MTGTTSTDYAAKVLRQCDRLATISEEPDRLTRRFATPALAQANEAVLYWMRELEMHARVDAIGNVVGRWEPPGASEKTLLMGSHLDSVRDAGRYDGPLGVLVALACVERLRDEDVVPPFALEVVGFADEEGVRYNTAYLGSKVVAGSFDPDYLERTDPDGVSMRDAIRAFGGDPDGLGAERRDPASLLGYCEVHIEQGPVLEAEDLPVGVVESIAGQTRAGLAFRGTAGHAGTVPMPLRRDALVGAAEWIARVDARAREEEGLVATVGVLEVEPGASNVIPGRVDLTLDVRSGRDAVRERALEDLRAGARAVAAARGLEVDWEVGQESPSIACSPELTRLMGEAVEAAGHPLRSLASGAGHDAVALSSLTPVTMLFVRCAGGISHNPAESVAEADVAVAIDVLGRFVQRLGAGR
jgi:allantoate deiminase